MNTEELRDLANDAILEIYVADFYGAATPAAILELIAEIDSLRDEINGLTGTLERVENERNNQILRNHNLMIELRESRRDNAITMGWLSDCRTASGDNGERMLPAFVEYLHGTKRQRDELLAALNRILSTPPGQADGGGFVADHFDSEGEYIGSQGVDPMWVVQEMASVANAAIAKAEAKS